MVRFYRKESKGTGIRWRGRRFAGTRPTFPYMVDYFVRVISRRPSTTRYQWLRKIVRCILRRDPVNNRVLRNWVQQAIRGRKDRNTRIPACVKHLWGGRINQKPNYHDLASLVRFAIFNRRITYKGLYTFIWSVLNEDRPTPSRGHTNWWKRYNGKQQYVSGLRFSQKFVIINAQKKFVIGNTLQQSNNYKQNNRNYYFYDDSMKAIRWLGNSKYHIGVHGGVRAGSRVRLVPNRGKTIRRQDMFVYDTVDMKFHAWTNKDLCITFRNPSRNGEQMVLARCHSGRSTQQELLVKYFEYDNNNGFKPWRVFTVNSRANKHMAIKIDNDGSLLLPSQKYAKIAFGNRNHDEEKFYWDPTAKCLKNYMFNDGCIGLVQQGCSAQMVSMGKSGDTGNTCGSTKWDGSFLWVNGKVAQPQSGYILTNNVNIALNDLSGEKFQQWTLRYSGIMANRQRSRARPSQADPYWGFQRGGYFEIRSNNGHVITLSGNNRVYLQGRTGRANQQWTFDANTKTIRSRANGGLVLASKQIGRNRFRLVAQRQTRASPELFYKPSGNGIINMAANKNMVWRRDGNSVSIVPGNGDRNWGRSRTYFGFVRR